MKKRIILGIIIALILIIGALGIKGFLSKNKPNDNINENNSDTINEGLYLKEGTLTYYKNGKKI